MPQGQERPEEAHVATVIQVFVGALVYVRVCTCLWAKMYMDITGVTIRKQNKTLPYQQAINLSSNAKS